MKKFLTVSFLFATLVLGGCAEVVGGALGGYIGSTLGSGSGRLATTAGGAVLGTVLGSRYGSAHAQNQNYQQYVVQQPQQTTVPCYVSTSQGSDGKTQWQERCYGMVHRPAFGGGPVFVPPAVNMGP